MDKYKVPIISVNVEGKESGMMEEGIHKRLFW